MELVNASKSTTLNKSSIGKKVQQLLDQHKVSLSKVAAATGLTAETIRQIVNGTIKNPGIDTLTKIAEAFSLTLFDLLGSRDVTAHIHKKQIKIIDLLDLKKQHPVDDLIAKSIESTEIVYIEESSLNADFFAVSVNASLADKLSSSGMPLLNAGDLLIFTKEGAYNPHDIIMAKSTHDAFILGIIMDIEDPNLWIKSVDLPQKQVVIKIKKSDIVGIVHNVQFT
jgi:transcriptional regulator with XRE-family HTH domain